MIQCHGIAHTTLTVTNIQQTKAFYEELFDTSFDMDDDTSFSLISVGIPVWFVQWQKKLVDRFNERRVGLDHIAFEVKNIGDLEKVETKLTQMKVKHAGIERFAGKYPYIAFRDPDNIQTEFFINKEVEDDKS